MNINKFASKSDRIILNLTESNQTKCDITNISKEINDFYGKVNSNYKTNQAGLLILQQKIKLEKNTKI